MYRKMNFPLINLQAPRSLDVLVSRCLPNTKSDEIISPIVKKAELQFRNVNHQLSLAGGDCCEELFVSARKNQVNFDSGVKIRRNLELIRNLLENCDIMCLQETILSSHAFHIADELNDDNEVYDYSFVSSSRDGRSSGGLAFIWKR